MKRFIVRIELHKAVWPDDYKTLHTAMKSQRFTNEILGDDRFIYELPTAEYYRIGNESIDQVLQLAMLAANTVGKKFGVIVSETSNSKWEGLNPIRKT